MEFNHKPVLFEETINALAIRPEGTYIDGTLGGGGHSEAILQRLTTGRLLSIDQDPDAIRAAGGTPAGAIPIPRSSTGTSAAWGSWPGSVWIDQADGVLLDIGVSSYQLIPRSAGSPTITTRR